MSGMMNSETLLAAYLALCILTAAIVYSFQRFDSRPVAAGDGVGDYLVSDGFFDRPDRALLMMIFGLLGILLFAYLGWRLPQEIHRIAEGQSSFRLFSPAVTLGPLGKAAQVVGGVCMALIALRMIRFAMMLAFAVTMMASAFAAYGYIFG